MSLQAELNGSAKPELTINDVTSHASGLAYDLITLAELQGRLLFIDLREASQRSAITLVLFAALTVFTVSAVPVCLIGSAELLVDAANWHRASAYLTVGCVAACGALLGAIMAAKRLVKITAVFARSHQEFQDNLEFIKRLVSSPKQDFSNN